MRSPNPVQELLHDAMGIDTFSLDGDETRVSEPWQDRPDVHKTD